MSLYESIKSNLKEAEKPSTEEYWDAKEITRDGFMSLMKFNFGSDARGNNYIILLDANDVKRFHADSDEEAIDIYHDWLAKEKGKIDFDFDNHYERI